MSRLLTIFLSFFIILVPHEVFFHSFTSAQSSQPDIFDLETQLFPILTNFPLPKPKSKKESLIFDQLNQIINSNSWQITNKIEYPYENIENNFFKLRDLIKKNVDPLYKNFLTLIMDNATPERLLELRPSTENFFTQLKLLANNSSNEILNLITNKKKCDCTVSTSSAILDVYKLTIRSILRLHIINRYLTNPIEILQIKNSTISLQNELQISKYQKTMKKAMKFASKIEICSKIPKKQKRYDTFIELENSLRYELVNTIDVANESCSMECDFYREKTTFHQCTSTTNMCTWQNVIKEQLFPKTLHMKITENDLVYMPFGTMFRALGNFFIDTVRLMGISYLHSGPTKNIHVSLLPDCRQCGCYCTHSFEDPNSIQTISFLEATSDIKDNKVITGAQFILHEKMVHIKIQQGTLSPFAGIELSDGSWMSVPNVKWQNQSSKIAFNLDGINLIPDYNFARITQASFVNSIISLKTLIVPQDHVITGLRMNYEKQSYFDEIAPFGLEIQSTPFNFISGQLKSSESEWHKSEWLQEKDQQVRSNIFMSNDKYSNFGVVMLNNETMVTLPYFNAEPVVTMPPSALRGISLSLEQATSVEKYLTIKLLPLDMSNYMV